MKEKNKEPLFHIVKRDALPWYKSLGIRFVAILLALILCGIITTITTGINPLQVYQSIILGAFGSVRKTWVTFQNIAILLLIALDRKSTRLNSSHNNQSRMPSSA